jgi:hypothetical protein
MTIATAPASLLQPNGDTKKLPFPVVSFKGAEELSVNTVPSPNDEDDQSLYDHFRHDSVLNSPWDSQESLPLPRTQSALILHGLRQPYRLTTVHQVPKVLAPNELVIRIQAVGLNPIDWKSVDYGFGIPELPYIAGRDFAGVVVQAPKTASDIREGDIVRHPVQVWYMGQRRLLTYPRFFALPRTIATCEERHTKSTLSPWSTVCAD